MFNPLGKGSIFASVEIARSVSQQNCLCFGPFQKFFILFHVFHCFLFWLTLNTALLIWIGTFIILWKHFYALFMCLFRFIFLLPVFIRCYCDNFPPSRTLKMLLVSSLLIIPRWYLSPGRIMWLTDSCPVLGILCSDLSLGIKRGFCNSFRWWVQNFWLGVKVKMNYFHRSRIMKGMTTGRPFHWPLESCGTETFLFSPPCLCTLGKTQVSPTCKTLRVAHQCFASCSRAFRKYSQRQKKKEKTTTSVTELRF